MADRPTFSGGIVPEVRDRLVRLLADELGRACAVACADGGDPRRVAAVIDERRRALSASLPVDDDRDR